MVFSSPAPTPIVFALLDFMHNAYWRKHPLNCQNYCIIFIVYQTRVFWTTIYVQVIPYSMVATYLHVSSWYGMILFYSFNAFWVLVTKPNETAIWSICPQKLSMFISFSMQPGLFQKWLRLEKAGWKFYINPLWLRHFIL